MREKELLRKIVVLVQEVASRWGIKVKEVVLFGSRARGNARKDSDWDILVLLEKDPGWKIRRKFQAELHYRLVRSLKRPVDLLVMTADRFSEKSRIPTSFEAEVKETGIVSPL